MIGNKTLLERLEIKRAEVDEHIKQYKKLLHSSQKGYKDLLCQSQKDYDKLLNQSEKDYEKLFKEFKKIQEDYSKKTIDLSNKRLNDCESSLLKTSEDIKELKRTLEEIQKILIYRGWLEK
jgi:F0F1-type ATP synthase membrane subunit b/b'